MAIKREIKVGLFVLLGLIMSGAIIFLIGDERRVFDKHYRLNATFDDVAGLKTGAPVRMGGIDVGSVESVRFGPAASDKRVHVRFQVVRTAHERIRVDSLVTISNKGLLGDKMLEVTQGAEAQQIIPDGGEVRSVPPDDIQKYLTKVNDILESLRNILKNVEVITGSTGDQKTADDLKSSLHSIRVLLDDAARNDGFAHRLLADPKMADHLDEVFLEGSRAGKSFDRVAAEMRLLLSQVRDGPGVLHTLFYSKDGDRIVAHLADAATELAATMKEVRTGKGAAHELVYGDTGTDVSKDVAALIGDMRQIIADVKAGKGTLGALLVDPSVYEDVKSILGNVDRNQVLRAIVRYSIKQDERAPTIATKRPAPPGSSGVMDPPKAAPPVIPKP